MTIEAHYDGKVIVPEGPVDLPINRKLRLDIALAPPRETCPSKAEREAAFEEFLSLTPVPAGIADEYLRREKMYED